MSTSSQSSDLSYADTLWKSADALRGQVDAAEYKHVVLGLLFLKYISDSFQSRRDELQAELTEAEKQIREKLGTQKLGQLIDARVNEVLEKAKSLNGDLKKAAQQAGLELKTPPEFIRSGAVEGLGGANYVDQAFTLPVGQIFLSQKLNEQRFICKVVARTPADMSQFAAQRATLLQEVKNTKARERLELLQEGIRDQLIKEGKIKIHQDVINRLVTSYRGS